MPRTSLVQLTESFKDDLYEVHQLENVLATVELLETYRAASKALDTRSPFSALLTATITFFAPLLERAGVPRRVLDRAGHAERERAQLNLDLETSRALLAWRFSPSDLEPRRLAATQAAYIAQTLGRYAQHTPVAALQRQLEAKQEHLDTVAIAYLERLQEVAPERLQRMQTALTGAPLTPSNRRRLVKRFIDDTESMHVAVTKDATLAVWQRGPVEVIERGPEPDGLEGPPFGPSRGSR